MKWTEPVFITIIIVVMLILTTMGILKIDDEINKCEIIIRKDK